jgi:glutamate synthase (NADPH/NADH) small chain
MITGLRYPVSSNSFKNLTGKNNNTSKMSFRGGKQVCSIDEIPLDKFQVIAEAKRCLKCINPPCEAACPLGNKISEYLKKIVDGDFAGAFVTLSDRNPLSGITPRICPSVKGKNVHITSDKACESACTRGIKGDPIQISKIERFLSDNRTLELIKTSPTGKKVAIIGCGPAGLSSAYFLAKNGYQVTIYEATRHKGGVLKYGIPEFRLPKDVLKEQIKAIENLGVTINTSTVVGRDVSISELNHAFDAICVSTGAGVPNKLGIPGENLYEVMSGNKFLVLYNIGISQPEYSPFKLGKTALILGGGNTAIDCARAVKRLKFIQNGETKGYENVILVYRRTKEELPASLKEMRQAEAEGITFIELHQPVEIIGKDGAVSKVKFEKMELGDPDESGRRAPISTGEFVEIDADMVIAALGSKPDPYVVNSAIEDGINIQTNRSNQIIINPKTRMTSADNIFAAGDAAPTGDTTATRAILAGRNAAEAIHKKFTGSSQ